MIRVEISRGSLLLSQIALGGRFGEIADAEAFAILDAYVALGGNTIDTAHSYADGASEQQIGRWIAACNNREKIVLVDKGAHPDASGAPRVTPKCIHEDLAESLDRLQTHYVDLYLVHRDDPTVPVGPIMEALNDELRAGRIRALGASNWSHHRINEAQVYAAKRGLVGFSASSCQFSLAVPNEPMWPGCISVDTSARQWHIRSRLPLIAWSSQARGWFSGRYKAGAAHRDTIRVYYSEENLRRATRAEQLADKLSLTALQIGLAYVLSQPFPVVALIGPANSEELRESMRAGEVHLDSAELAYLEGREAKAKPIDL